MAGEVGSLNTVITIQATSTGSTSDPILGSYTTPPIAAGNTQRYINTTSLPTGAILVNQCKCFATTIAASGTTTLDLSAANANILNNTAATFDKLVGGIFWLPKTTDPVMTALAVAVQASSITIGNTASNQNDLFMTNATSSFDLYPGRVVGWMETGTHTVAINGTQKSLLITNNDSSNAATLIIQLAGLDN
jgi:hypothetical protein